VGATYPSEKSWSERKSVGMMKFPIYGKYGKIKRVPNHPPDMIRHDYHYPCH
jgi:hypothetical protein